MGKRIPLESYEQRLDRLIFMKRLVHDLNNALSIVKINAGLMDGESGESLHELTAEVVAASERAAGLTRQLSRCISEVSESLPMRWPGGPRQTP